MSEPRLRHLAIACYGIADMEVGIERINAYLGQACIDVRLIFESRGLDTSHFGNLLMNRKSVWFTL